MALEDTQEAPVAETEPEVHATADVSPVVDEKPTDVSSGGGDGSEVSTGVDEEFEQIAGMYGLESSDPKVLVKFLSAELARDFAQQGRQAQNPQREQQTPAQAKAAAVAALELDKLLPPDLPAGEWDEAVINRDKQFRAAFKALHDHYNSRFSSMQDELTKPVVERIAAMEQYHARQESERNSQQIDSFFDGLGAEGWTEFGKGSVRGMSPHSLHLKARNAVVEQAAAIQAGYQARGMQSPELNTLLKQALHSLHSDKVTTTARQKLIQDATAKKNSATAGAGAKRSAPPTGREAAKQVVKLGWQQLQSGIPAE